MRRNAAEVEERFRARNLGDTRYATRILLDLLARLYPADGVRHVLAQPGLTAKLRRAWGLEDIKKDAAGKRLEDDRHHALDALVVAAINESMLQRLTRAFQEAEQRGRPRDFAAVEEPWDGISRGGAGGGGLGVRFQSGATAGARRAHAATIRQVRERDGKWWSIERRPWMR